MEEASLSSLSAAPERRHRARWPSNPPVLRQTPATTTAPAPRVPTPAAGAALAIVVV
jgi:hypothetical protein